MHNEGLNSIPTGLQKIHSIMLKKNKKSIPNSDENNASEETQSQDRE